MPITTSRLAPGTNVRTETPSEAPAEHHELKLVVPSGLGGVALSTISGLAGTALPDVEIRARRSALVGRNAEIEIVARGTPAELEQLQNLIRNSVDTRLRDEGPSNGEEARRLLGLDDGAQPRPVRGEGVPRGRGRRHDGVSRRRPWRPSR